ncbi:MAG: hypothetical protein LBT01_09110 [Spirochaetaceae bacterium]|jgi:hypothetical protein|nr:hypothetical protein [Spirochaetaceae bacterium]
MNVGCSQNAEFLTATSAATGAATGGFCPCERRSQSKQPKQVYCCFYAATGAFSDMRHYLPSAAMCSLWRLVLNSQLPTLSAVFFVIDFFVIDVSEDMSINPILLSKQGKWFRTFSKTLFRLSIDLFKILLLSRGCIASSSEFNHEPHEQHERKTK